MTNGLLATLYALRTQIDAAIAQVHDAMGIPAGGGIEPGGCPKCKAGPESVEDASTMRGAKRSRCTNCGKEWKR